MTMKRTVGLVLASLSGHRSHICSIHELRWSGEPAIAQDKKLSRPAAAASIDFRDVAQESGVSFRFDTGSRGKHDLPEIMGGGLALFDADGDGRLDIYLCNGGPIEPGPGTPDPPCRLFRNLGDWHFEDTTDRAAAPGPSYAMARLSAITTATAESTCLLPAGAIRDFIAISEGVASRMSLSVRAWCQVSGARRRHSQISTATATWTCTWPTISILMRNHLLFRGSRRPRDYCGPEDCAAQPDRLYRNNGDGTFTDIATLAGIDQPDGRGLGVLIAELTGDDRPDVFVANDGTSCWLFANRGNMHFEEIGATAGLARDGQGRALAGMGVATGDVNGDGRCDLLVTNFFGRSTIGFVAQANPTRGYRDGTSRFGLAAATRQVLGFGIILADFDGDGWADLIQTNGHVLDRVRLGIPLAMRPTLLGNKIGRFDDPASDRVGWFDRPILGRGLAVGDLDGDGRPDLVASSLDAPPALTSQYIRRWQHRELEHRRPE